MAMATSAAKGRNAQRTPNEQAESASESAPSHRPPFPAGAPLAWVARAWLNPDGTAAQPGDAEAVRVLAVSVHAGVPTSVDARMDLLRSLAKEFQTEVPAGRHSLWVLPGGFFGFDSARHHWTGLSSVHAEAIAQRLLTDIAPKLPPLATLVVGVDLAIGTAEDQHAWVIQRNSHGSASIICKVQRGGSELSARCFSVGTLRASVFICGEFCGSYTEQNGPYCGEGMTAKYLTDPVRDLAECGLLIDLAHIQVRGTVSDAEPSRRLSHQRQLERFASHGAGLLVHHHYGLTTAKGTPHFAHQSAWLIFRNGVGRGKTRQWLDALDRSAVKELYRSV